MFFLLLVFIVNVYASDCEDVMRSGLLNALRMRGPVSIKNAFLPDKGAAKAGQTDVDALRARVNAMPCQPLVLEKDGKQRSNEEIIEDLIKLDRVSDFCWMQNAHQRAIVQTVLTDFFSNVIRQTARTGYDVEREITHTTEALGRLFESMAFRLQAVEGGALEDGVFVEEAMSLLAEWQNVKTHLTVFLPMMSSPEGRKMFFTLQPLLVAQVYRKNTQ